MTTRTTRVGVTAQPNGRARVDLRSGLLAPRLLSSGPDQASVALVATTATLLAGDHVRLEVDVGPGVRLELRDVAGTVAYDGRGGEARWDMAIRIASDAALTWHGEPLVVSAGASVHRSLHVDIAAGGRLLLRDTVALGRSGEPPGALTCRTRMTYDGRPALAEDLTLSPETVALPGLLGGSRVIDTVTAIGWRPADVPDGPATLHLAEPGVLARELVTDAHQSRLTALWHTWA
ncbi:urease accessory protein UreD [Luteipulveratus mongoliensis]|uniref:Urease accessory protein UreD n=1 Tax=Luteipulveratus mongoliensis TaxID=571913 RepID=A0A0K1JMV5_9MICO|nr:urease accessory protein UreD [Luteipulveratus mongoliensis]AKU17910.1 hypothetical protein VV02_22015 [Luteipulveratus mongoliensis]